MRRSTAALVSLSIILLPLMSGAQDAGDLVQPLIGQSPLMKRIPNQYIVILKEGANIDALADELPRKFNGKALEIYKHALKGFSLSLSDSKINDLLKDPRVESVSPDYEVTIYDRPDIFSRPDINGLIKGFAAQSQTLSTGIDRINAEFKANKGAGVEVAVIDTGIDTNHPDLKANILGGKTCNGFNYNDQNGHGTHVAGTIAALENGVGVVGVAPQAKLWAVRVLNANGGGTWSQVICGIDWVTANASHIKVANMSLGGGGTSGSCTSDALHRAICNSVSAGVTYVVAAGNDGRDFQNSVPAAYPEVITVTALGDSNGRACGGGAATNYSADDAYASFSNYATQSEDLAHTIGAPGVSILSTWKSKSYNTISGTSMATPHVAGAAALYISTHPGATPAEVRDALLASGEPGNTDFNSECAGGVSHTGTANHPEPVLRADGL